MKMIPMRESNFFMNDIRMELTLRKNASNKVYFEINREVYLIENFVVFNFRSYIMSNSLFTFHEERNV